MNGVRQYRAGWNTKFFKGLGPRLPPNRDYFRRCVSSTL
jgi:hypothetical protein